MCHSICSVGGVELSLNFFCSVEFVTPCAPRANFCEMKLCPVSLTFGAPWKSFGTGQGSKSFWVRQPVWLLQSDVSVSRPGQNSPQNHRDMQPIANESTMHALAEGQESPTNHNPLCLIESHDKRHWLKLVSTRILLLESCPSHLTAAVQC